MSGVSQFTRSFIWLEALETTAERKSAAIVLPCPNSPPPSPRNTIPPHHRGSALAFFGPAKPARTTVALAVGLLLPRRRRQRSGPGWEGAGAELRS